MMQLIPDRRVKICAMPRVAHHTGLRNFMEHGKYGHMRVRSSVWKKGFPGDEVARLRRRFVGWRVKGASSFRPERK